MAIQPDRIFTTGSDGYDGHSDHIAMHVAAVEVAADYCKILALTRRSGNEDLWVPAHGSRKLSGMEKHVSQRQHTNLAYWGNTDFYTSLIVEGEAYQHFATNDTSN